MRYIQRAGTLWVLLLLAELGVAARAAEAPAESPGFTLSSAAYQQHYAAFHRGNLEGEDIVPPLVGIRFDQSCRGKLAAALAFHIRRMPPDYDGDRACLSDATYAHIAAHILNANEFEPGDEVVRPPGLECQTPVGNW